MFLQPGPLLELFFYRFSVIIVHLYSFVYRLSATVKEVGRLRSEKAELEERLAVLQKRRYCTTSANIRHTYRQTMGVATFLEGKGAMRLSLCEAPASRETRPHYNRLTPGTLLPTPAGY